jgi:beta-galactosidase/beta-glucuronidase
VENTDEKFFAQAAEEKNKTPLYTQQSTNYPRPQLRRKNWTCLNGEWQFLFDIEKTFHNACEEKPWAQKILVPYCPESALSGIGDLEYHSTCWYERKFSWNVNADKRVLLHFGAVDYSCKVWINNHFIGSHDGGFSSFNFDITTHLDPTQEMQKVTVCVYDDPLDLAKPRGKQDWQREPHSIWYPRTTGIWQTVWLEEVASTYIERVDWTPFVERWEIDCLISLSGKINLENLELKVKLMRGDQVLVNDRYQVIMGEVHRRLALSDPGIDDFRNELLWSPEKPTLIQAQVELWHEDVLLDQIESYTALRSFSIRKDRVLLNGRPYYMRLVLDQGYWPESLMTAPYKDAHKHDILLTKQMGFNGVRKHQKIEDPNYLYWADVLGLLVFEEMPSAYRFTHDGVEKIAREWIDIMDRDRNHPCVCVWVPFNESWGVPDLAEKKAHQHCVQALFHLTHTLDPTRPVIGNDGWESTATDIIGIHDYDNNPQRMNRRYSSRVPASEILTSRQPAGRPLRVDGYPQSVQPIMLTEFGGIAYAKEKSAKNNLWGYAVGHSQVEFQSKLTSLLLVVNKIELFTGFCYTQLTDTFQEVNGLLFADRTPKIPLEIISACVRGKGLEREEGVSETVPALHSPAALIDV